jgi:hypothetical protein
VVVRGEERKKGAPGRPDSWMGFEMIVFSMVICSCDPKDDAGAAIPTRPTPFFSDGDNHRCLDRRGISKQNKKVRYVEMRFLLSDLAALRRPQKGSPMLYTLLCYNDESVTSAWSEEKDAAVMACLGKVHEKYAKQFGPVVRLMPTTAAATYRKSQKMVTDGPYAETKEQLLGFHVIDVEDLEQAIQIVRELSDANPGGAYEIRPIMLFYPNGAAVNDG